MSYQTLFSRAKIGNLTLRNRIVMPAMGTSFAEYNNEAGERIIRYYEERAKGGCGLIITEITRVDEETGVGLLHQLSASSAKYLKGLKALTQAVQRHDCAIFLQLQHPGRATPSYLIGGRETVSASALPDPVVGSPTRAMGLEEIKEMVEKFVAAACVAKASGFNGVEIHGAHGYLVDQFLSPYSNKREDAYGGSPENRMRFLAEIVEGIRAACGRNYPLSVRLSADEFVDGGLTIEDSVEIARRLESLGVDAINVSCGVYASGHTCIEPSSFPEGWKRHLGAAVKKAVGIPVIATSNIKRPEVAEELLRDQSCDFVAIGRGQLADARWAEKARQGREDEIRKCIGCLHCFNVLDQGAPLVCTANPLLGREYLYNDKTLERDGEGRRVAVIGGGPGGMQAAHILARRGFRPVIIEKADSLGGTLNLGDKPPHKTLITELVNTMRGELERQEVPVHLNCAATVEKVLKLEPWAVFLATGGEPIIPEVPGVDAPTVCTAEEVLSGRVALSGKRIAVIGGGVTGLETAEFLGDGKGNEITVVEMLGAVGTTLYATARLTLLARLEDAGVRILTRHKLVEVLEDAVLLEHGGETVRQPVDQVVLALGVRPRAALREAFEAAFERLITVGDAGRTGMIVDAMTEGNDRAWVL